MAKHEKPYRLGFLVDSLESPIGRTLTRSINEFYRDGKREADLLVFYAEAAAPEGVPMFASMNATEVFDFSGDVIATDPTSAANLIACPGPRRRFFWSEGPGWSALRQTWNYVDFLSVYRNPLLRVLVGREEDRRLVERCWNREVSKVVGLDDMSHLIEVMKNAR